MNIEIRAYCDNSYFGSDCSQFCKNANDTTGHYTCHPTSGEKICLPGTMLYRDNLLLNFMIELHQFRD